MLMNFAQLMRPTLWLCAAAAVALTVPSAQACHRGGNYGHGYAARPVYYGSPTYVVPAYSPVSYPVQATVSSPAPTSTPMLVAHAKQMLKARNYGSAQQAIDVALQREPKNAALLQLKSLISFAQSDYQTSAAMAYSALTLGRSFDWNVVRQLYPSAAEYTQQYHQLSAVVKDKPDQAHLQFLLAYHHLMLGHQQQGRQALVAAQEKLPQDKLIPMLLSQLPAEPKLPESLPAAEVAVDETAPAVK